MRKSDIYVQITSHFTPEMPNFYLPRICDWTNLSVQRVVTEHGKCRHRRCYRLHNQFNRFLFNLYLSVLYALIARTSNKFPTQTSIERLFCSSHYFLFAYCHCFEFPWKKRLLRSNAMWHHFICYDCSNIPSTIYIYFVLQGHLKERETDRQKERSESNTAVIESFRQR